MSTVMSSVQTGKLTWANAKRQTQESLFYFVSVDHKKVASFCAWTHHTGFEPQLLH